MNKIKKYIIGFFTMLSGILFAFLSGKSAGRKQEKLGGLKNKIKYKEKAIKKTEKLQKNVKKNLLKNNLNQRKQFLMELKKN